MKEEIYDELEKIRADCFSITDLIGGVNYKSLVYQKLSKGYVEAYKKYVFYEEGSIPYTYSMFFYALTVQNYGVDKVADLALIITVDFISYWNDEDVKGIKPDDEEIIKLLEKLIVRNKKCIKKLY